MAEPDRLSEILPRIRAVIDEVAMPLEAELLSGAGFRGLLPKLAEGRVRIREAGLWAPQLGKEWGGLGLTLTEHAQVSEALGRTPVGHYLFNAQAPDAGNMEILVQWGSAAQKSAWLTPVADGKARRSPGRWTHSPRDALDRRVRAGIRSHVQARRVA